MTVFSSVCLVLMFFDIPTPQTNKQAKQTNKHTNRQRTNHTNKLHMSNQPTAAH
jgi:hypothetical protein